MLPLVQFGLICCGLCVSAWIAAVAIGGRRSLAGVRIATWLQIATFAVLASCCVLLLALGMRRQALWAFFLLIAVPLALIDLWASVRLALQEGCGRRAWPRLAGSATVGGSRGDRPK